MADTTTAAAFARLSKSHRLTAEVEDLKQLHLVTVPRPVYIDVITLFASRILIRASDKQSQSSTSATCWRPVSQAVFALIWSLTWSPTWRWSIVWSRLIYGIVVIAETGFFVKTV